ncbi:MAG TPA: TIGR02281 family clan AA aspartic protease [Sphingomonas sp.]|jgi:aspartyl protease family protein|nr:TIGR02281 family clan AA aspartic protease [Sphingomonas sp.]
MTIGMIYRPQIALLLAALCATGARSQRDTLMDALAPTAQAAIVTPVEADTGVVASIPAQDVQRGADGLFYVHALVNRRPIRFIVDTGASVVVLTAADARAVGIEVAPRHYSANVNTVGGNTPMAWATVDQIDLAGHEIRGLKAAVVRDGLGVSLLGQNVLARLHSVTITADRLSLR